jgi:hypothetical protein
MRQRVTDRFTALYEQARELHAQLAETEAAQPAAQDLSLIDELPHAAAALDTAPDNVKAKLYAAFDVQVLFRAPKKQATIWATITSTTPGIVASLVNGPRTDNDTAYGNLPNDPMWSLSTSDPGSIPPRGMCILKSAAVFCGGYLGQPSSSLTRGMTWWP